MKIVVAIDSFKGSLSSMEAGRATEAGIRKVMDAQVDVVPLADGGEGTVEALISGMQGEYQTIEVTGPLRTKVSCRYGIIKEKSLGIIEMSQAAGITLVPKGERNPLNTTTYGVGEVILDAISKGCKKFIVGIGGSATNDGGVGMLMALGFEFLNQEQKPISLGAKGLAELALIKTDKVLKDVLEAEFLVACDVVNPLCGENGCSAIYGPQKGANEAMIKKMDKDLLKYSQLVKSLFGKDNASVPGTGAAGGMGYAFLSFLNSRLESGIQIVLKETELEKKIMDADIVITGEGRLDYQTAMGKAPIGVAQLAKKYHKTVLAFAGCVTSEATECNLHGIDAFFPILRRLVTLEQAMEIDTAKQNLTDCVEQVFRLIAVYRK